MNNGIKQVISKIFALISIALALLFIFFGFFLTLQDLLNLVHNKPYDYNATRDSFITSFFSVAGNAFFVLLGSFLICAGVLVLKSKTSSIDESNDEGDAPLKSGFLQIAISPKSLYYTNIVVASIIGLLTLFMGAVMFIFNNQRLDFLFGVIFIIITVYLFKAVKKLYTNRHNIPTSNKKLFKDIIRIPFRPRSIFLISSLVLIFLGFAIIENGSFSRFGELDALIFLALGIFLFTRVKYFCKVCGKKMSRIESTYTGTEYNNFKLHSVEDKVWIEGEIRDNYDYLYWCSHCEGYERVISKSKLQRIRVD